MANLWQFFGLPDPDVQTKPVEKGVKPVIKENRTPIPKQEVKEEVKSKKEVKSEWGQFWKGEYETQRGNANAAQDVQSGDYN